LTTTQLSLLAFGFSKNTRTLADPTMLFDNDSGHQPPCGSVETVLHQATTFVVESGQTEERLPNKTFLRENWPQSNFPEKKIRKKIRKKNQKPILPAF
jgi:hypothetical protein